MPRFIDKDTHIDLRLLGPELDYVVYALGYAGAAIDGTRTKQVMDGIAEKLKKQAANHIYYFGTTGQLGPHTYPPDYGDLERPNKAEL